MFEGQTCSLGRTFTTSSYPDPQEIYVEEVWRLNENDALTEMVVSTAGGFVRAEDCKFIEFLKVEEN
jgi:Family of unknown function (DUF6338)